MATCTHIETDPKQHTGEPLENSMLDTYHLHTVDLETLPGAAPVGLDEILVVPETETETETDDAGEGEAE